MVYQGLGCADIIFEGQADSSKHLNLLYDEVERNYHVITKLTGAMAKKYVCNARHKSCRRDITHVSDQTCSDCMASPPCVFSDVRIPWDICNTHLRVGNISTKKQSTTKRKSVCERKRICATCGLLVTADRQESKKVFYANCKQNRDVGHLCYMSPLKDVLPTVGDKVYSDFETTQNSRH